MPPRYGRIEVGVTADTRGMEGQIRAAALRAGQNAGRSAGSGIASGIVNSVAGAAGRVGSAAGRAASAVVSGFSRAASAVGSAFARAGSAIQTGLGRAFSAVQGIAGRAFAGVQTAAGRAGAAAGAVFSRATGSAGAAIQSGLGRAFAAVSSAAGRAGAAAGGVFTRAAGSAGAAISNGLGRAYSAVSSAAGRAASAAGGAFTRAASSAGGAIQSGLGKAFAAVSSAGGRAAEAIGQSFRSAQAAAGGGAGGGGGGGMLGGLLGTLSKVPMAGAAAAAGVGLLGGSILKTGASYNTLVQTSRKAFATVMGSTKAADQMMTDLMKFAKTSPFPRQAFIQATQQMLGFGIESKKVIPYLSAIQDTVAATGGNAQTLSEITLVMSQIRAAGKITGVDLMQFAQRGINAADLIGQSMGKTGKQIKDDITNGALDANQALDALVAGMNKNYGGAAAGLKTTWSGTLDSIKGSFRDLGGAIMAPFIDPKGGGYAVTWGNTLAKATRQAIPAVTAAMGGISTAIGAIVGGLDKILQLAGRFQGWLLPVAGAIMAVVVAVKLYQLAMATAVMVTNLYTVAVNAAKFAMFALQYAFVTNPIGIVVVAIIALAAAFFIAWKRSAAFRNFWIGLWAVVQRVFTATWQAIVAAVQWAWGAIQGVFNAIVAWVSGWFTPWWAQNGEAIKRIWSGIWTAVTTVITVTWQVIQTIFRVGSAVVLAVWRFLWTTCSAVFSALWGPLQAVIAAVWPVLQALFTLGAAILLGVWRVLWAGIQAYVTVVWAAVQAVLKIGWAILVGIFTIFINLLTGRWGAAWAALKAMVVQVWNAILAFMRVALGALLAVFSAVWGAIRGVVGAALGYLRAVVGLAWGAILGLTRAVWGAVAGAIGWAWGVVRAATGAALGWLRSVIYGAWAWAVNVTRSLWGMISGAISAVWNAIRTAVWNALNWIRSVMTQTFNFYLGLTRQIWGAISGAISGAWNTIKATCAGAGQWIMDKLSWVWNQIKTTATNTWNGIVSAIAAAWEKVKNVVAAPARFVAFNVINPLVRGINTLITKIGIPAIPEIPKFEQGGRIPGGWGGGDTQLILAEPGEWMLTKRQAAAIGYNRLRGLPRYAEGGEIAGPEIGQRSHGPMKSHGPFDWLGELGGKALKISHVGDLVKLGGDVVDTFSNMLKWAAAQAFRAATEPLRKLAQPLADERVPPGNVMRLYLGKLAIDIIDKAIGFIESKSASECDAGGVVAHAMQFEGKPYRWGGPANPSQGFDCSSFVSFIAGSAGLPLPGGFKVPSSTHGPVTTNYLSWGGLKTIGRDATRPGDIAVNTHHIGFIIGPGGAGFAARSTATGIGKQSFASGYTYRTWGGAAAGTGTCDGGTGPGGPPNGFPTGVKHYAGLVARIAAQLGVGFATNAFLSQMASESGGNPRAINNWDSNAKRGTPSKGLMQVIDPTFIAYAGPHRSKGIWNPEANIYAAIAYAKSRYGSRLLGVIGHGHGYARGGVINEHVVGVGQTTGDIYHIGEAGYPEMVTPLSGRTSAPEPGPFTRDRGEGGGVTVNVYPQPGQSEESIAAAVSRRLEWAAAGGRG